MINSKSNGYSEFLYFDYLVLYIPGVHLVLTQDYVL